MYNPRSIPLKNIEVLHKAFVNKDGASQFYNQRMGNLRFFREKINKALTHLKIDDMKTFKFFIGGSSTWQYINAIVNNKRVFSRTDTDTYAILEKEFIDTFRQHHLPLKAALANQFKIEESVIKNDVIENYLIVKYNEDDYGILERVQILLNFQVLIDEFCEIHYDPLNPNHETDFQRFIWDHEIIAYHLEEMIGPAKQHAECLFAAYNDRNIKIDLKSKEAQAFRKLVFVFRALYKPFQVDKKLSKETAQIFYDLFNDKGNENLIKQIAYSKLFKDKFTARNAAWTHINNIKAKANAIITPDQDNYVKMNVDQLVNELKIENEALENELLNANKSLLEVQSSAENRLTEMAKAQAESIQTLASQKAKNEEQALEIQKLKYALFQANQKITEMQSKENSMLEAARSLGEEITGLQQDKADMAKTLDIVTKENNELKSENNTLKAQILELKQALEEKNKPIEDEKKPEEQPPENLPKEVVAEPVVEPVESEDPVKSSKKKKKKNKHRKTVKSNDVDSDELDIDASSIGIYRKMIETCQGLSGANKIQMDESDDVIREDAKESFAQIPSEMVENYLMFLETMLGEINDFQTKYNKDDLFRSCFALVCSLPSGVYQEVPVSFDEHFSNFYLEWHALKNFLKSKCAAKYIQEDWLNKCIQTCEIIYNQLFDACGNRKDRLKKEVTNVSALIGFYNKYKNVFIKACQNVKNESERIEVPADFYQEYINLYKRLKPVDYQVITAEIYFYSTVEEESELSGEDMRIFNEKLIRKMNFDTSPYGIWFHNAKGLCNLPTTNGSKKEMELAQYHLVQTFKGLHLNFPNSSARDLVQMHFNFVKSYGKEYSVYIDYTHPFYTQLSPLFMSAFVSNAMSLQSNAISGLNESVCNYELFIENIIALSIDKVRNENIFYLKTDEVNSQMAIVGFLKHMVNQYIVAHENRNKLKSIYSLVLKKLDSRIEDKKTNAPLTHLFSSKPAALGLSENIKIKFFKSWKPLAVDLDLDPKERFDRNASLKSLFTKLKAEFPQMTAQELIGEHFSSICHLRIKDSSQKKIKSKSPLYTELCPMLEEKFLEKVSRETNEMKFKKLMSEQLSKTRDVLKSFESFLFTKTTPNDAIDSLTIEIMLGYNALLESPDLGLNTLHRAPVHRVLNYIMNLYAPSNQAYLPLYDAQIASESTANQQMGSLREEFKNAAHAVNNQYCNNLK